MKNLIYVLWGILFTCHLQVAGLSPDSTSIYNSFDLNTDPLTGRRFFGTFKISTLQVLFSEAPFTFELFLKENLSMQLQAGIIFPLESDSFLEQFFRSAGAKSTASPSGILLYRNSPTNNHGMSFKFELRKYISTFYYAPQLMYKYCIYNEADFPVLIEGRVMRQTESKQSKIFGLGMMLGRQTYFLKQATDWYIGGGFRARQITAKVIKIEDPSSHSNEVYPDKKENSLGFYPFFNFGFRLGLVL